VDFSGRLGRGERGYCTERVEKFGRFVGRKRRSSEIHLDIK